MPNEAIEGLNIKPDGIYVDATYGGGGHARAILERLDKGCLYVFDHDMTVAENLPDDDRVTFFHANYAYLKNFLKLHHVEKVDGILADLGVSSYQIDTPERGFSTRYEGRLDLRMNTQADLTAESVINTYTKSELSRIFKNYGELKSSAKIADAIIEARTIKPIETTTQLKECVGRFAPKYPEKARHKFFAQIFQAVRIEVNNELDCLKAFLEDGLKVLNEKGRMVIIAYHSLEDRLVKNFFKAGNFTGVVEHDFYGKKKTPFNVITKRPVTPCKEELLENNRARSAKLRIAEKKEVAHE